MSLLLTRIDAARMKRQALYRRAARCARPLTVHPVFELS
jgi:hypothetical protein